MQRKALITGASAGIGEALAREFAKHGHSLVLVARREGHLKKLAAELEATYEVSVGVYAVDLSRPGGPADLLDQLEKDQQRVDILVNNAGIGVFGPFWQTDWSEEQALLQLNMLTPTELTKKLLPGMRKRKFGCILNVASLAAFQPGPFMPLYYASKAYLLSLSESLAASLDGSGVTVTVSCPGPVATEFAEKTGAAEATIGWDRLGTISAEQVARWSYRALMRGQLLVIPSNRHEAFHWAGKLLPRGLRGRLLKHGQLLMRGKDRS